MLSGSAILLLMIAYALVVCCSVGYILYNWYKAWKSKQKPKLRIVRCKDD